MRLLSTSNYPLLPPGSRGAGRRSPWLDSRPPGHRPSGILSAGPHPSPLPPGFLPALATPAPIALVTMKITIPNLQSPHGARMPCKVYPSRVHARHVIHQQNIVNKGNEESASSHAKDASCRPGALAALKLSTELTLPLSPKAAVVREWTQHFPMREWQFDFFGVVVKK